MLKVDALCKIIQSLEIGIKRLKGVVPESHAERLHEFDLREQKRASLGYNPAAGGAGATLETINRYADHVNWLVGNAEKLEAEQAAQKAEPENACGEDFDPEQILLQANKHIEGMRASLLAITYVYASRVSKIANTVGDEEKLIIEHSENLRVANGKLKFLEPLIAERRGKTDRNSREELAKLLQEQSELEQLRATARQALEQTKDWHEQDSQEQKVLREEGGGVIATIEQQTEAMTPIKLLGIGSVGTGG